ncbi:MAG: DUF72 domain-containing protein [Gammaproteobacteria bacterium]|nr:DUF72 domain-containing protein [Gammaproteobacteria bacterium]
MARAAGRAATPPPEGGTAPVDGIRTGVGGWTYAPWRDNFYPRGLVQRRELEHASRRLSAIEINGTYYRMQSAATIARWRDDTPPGFVFTAKAPMRIVQSRVLAKTGGRVDDFVDGIAALGDRLGPLLWQFDSRGGLDRDDFAAFLDLLPREAGGRPLRHVLDVRDPGFVDAGYLELARRHGMATVFTDSPAHPSFADATAGFVYARLMRSRAGIATGYPRSELAQWARRAREWAAGGEPADLPRIAPAGAARQAPREVFMFFIGAAKERNPAAAMALHDLLVRSSR